MARPTSRPTLRVREVGALLALAATLVVQGCASAAIPRVRGIVWQPDASTTILDGDWDRLGVRELLIQWTRIDGKDLFATDRAGAGSKQPDLAEVGRRPWARQVIVGLAGMRSERDARSSVAALAEASREAVARGAPPFTVSGWYFPIELDPTWKDVATLRQELDTLPRPLWISIYDSANLGPDALIAQVRRAVPSDVGLFFQDGVGVEARTPSVARTYLDALVKAFGRRRVRVIAEAFRPSPGGFRAASADELGPQIRAYAGFPIYLFDGPHYVSAELVDKLRRTGYVLH